MSAMNVSGLSPKVGVGLLVVKQQDDKTYIMLHRRKSKTGFGQWGGAGGHINHGESIMAAVLRELKEEAGPDIKVKNLKFLGVLNFTQSPPVHNVGIIFSAEWVSGEPVVSSPHETTEWQWFDIDNLPEPLFTPMRMQINAYKTGNNFFDSEF